MNGRAKELFQDFLRYLREAAAEWVDSFDDSPPSHAYTALLTIALWEIVKRIV